MSVIVGKESNLLKIKFNVDGFISFLHDRTNPGSSNRSTRTKEPIQGLDLKVIHDFETSRKPSIACL